MNKIITVLTSLVFASLLINPVKAQEKYPLPTKDNPLWLDASDGSRLTFYNYSIDNQIILLDGILSSPREADKNAILTFNCNINDTGLLTIGTLQQQTFKVESQEEFPADTLQIFRYSYCDDFTEGIQYRPMTYLTAEECSIAVEIKNKIELPCNYLAITVGDNAINYHYGLRNNQENLYSVSYGLFLNSINSIFAVMMNSKEEDPFNFEAQGQCQQQKINDRTDKLTCQAIAPDGSKINAD